MRQIFSKTAFISFCFVLLKFCSSAVVSFSKYFVRAILRLLYNMCRQQNCRGMHPLHHPPSPNFYFVGLTSSIVTPFHVFHVVLQHRERIIQYLENILRYVDKTISYLKSSSDPPSLPPPSHLLSMLFK